MNTIRSQWKDIVTSKKLLIPIIAILFVPLIYSGVFLKAYWDPYGTVDQSASSLSSTKTREQRMKEKNFKSVMIWSKN